MKTNNTPRLTLVGAGPGDPELITLKGLKALGRADVVLYDALISKELLKYAPLAKKVYVGKRKGTHYRSQDEINSLIVKYAFQYGHVVRLKGGDPYVFGRGAEEIDYAESFGIQTEVISGISSSLAVPAEVGISLTCRGVSQSFWVITGTTTAHRLSEDVALASRSTATVVILMGMSKISEIARLFVAAGKSETPVAVIQNGTTQEERFGLATVESMEEMVRNEGLENPAIIVIGEVVAKSTVWKKQLFDLNEMHSYAL